MRQSAPDEGVELKRRRLDSTQNIDDSTTPEEEFLDVSTPPVLPFGRLRSLQAFVPHYDLFKEVTTCGRGLDVDLTIGSQHVNVTWERMISKMHFEIIRDNSKESTYVKDVSLNGTFINNTKLAKGEKVEIFYGDVISFAVSTSSINYDTFVYSNISAEAVYPHILTKYYIMTGICLGKGAYGQVELARERRNCANKLAVKELRKERGANHFTRRICRSEDIKNEMQLMLKMDHPNIVRLMDFLDMEDSSYIILEFVNGGELFEKIIDPKWEAKGLGESLGRFYAYQLISAVQYLHSCGVTHRDIKPENILLVEKVDHTIAKLSDFGLAKSVQASTMKTYCGTPNYIAPEIHDEDRTPYKEYVDIWSLGVVLFTAYTGYPPFSTEYDDMPLKEQIKKGRLILLPHWLNISERDQSVIKRMLSVDPLKRPTAKELLSMDWMHTSETMKAKRMVEEYRLKRVDRNPHFMASLGTPAKIVAAHEAVPRIDPFRG